MEPRFRALVENAFDAINLLGADGTILYKSPGKARPLGYGDGLVDHSIFEIIHADDRERIARQYLELVGHPGESTRAELRVRHASGEWLWIDAVATNLLHEPAVGAIVLNYRDITETRRAREDLELSARLASLGTLAAGIAHEIDNPLTFTLGNLELVERRLSSMDASDVPAPLRAELHQIMSQVSEVRKGVQRVAAIGGDLTGLARVGSGPPVAVDVEHVLDAALAVASAELRGRAEVTRDYASVPCVLGDEGRLGQVFLNLLVNAVHAFQEGGPPGMVAISTRVSSHACVIVEVKDNGVGIRPDHLSRVFEPFFTTKPAGKGLGLGLSISQRIVKDLGGELSVESVLGTGSAFRVTLPMAVRPVTG